MAAIQSAFNMFRPALGLRLLVIHRVARHSAAFRVTEGFAKYFSDTVTHTGQSWTEDDYRNARFTDRQKEVNPRFAINLVAEEPVVVIDGSHTYCDGGDGALGHPKVYINLDQPGEHPCGYCGKRFTAQMH